MVVTEDGTLDLASQNKFFDNYLIVIAECFPKRGAKLAELGNFADPYGGTQVRRLDKQRHAESTLHFGKIDFIRAFEGHELADANSRVAQQPLHHIFIHTDRGAQYAG